MTRTATTPAAPAATDPTLTPAQQQVLDALPVGTSNGDALTVRDVVEATGLAPSTVRRALDVLRGRGVVVHGGGVGGVGVQFYRVPSSTAVAADKVLVEGPRTRTPEELASITDEERAWVEAENERFIVFGEVEVAAAQARRREAELARQRTADVDAYLAAGGPAATDPHLVRLRELGEVELADRQAADLAGVTADRYARSRESYRSTARRLADEVEHDVAEARDGKLAADAIELADNVASLHTVTTRHAGRGPAVKLVGVKLTQAELDDLDELVAHLGAYAGGDRSSALRWAITTLGTLARASNS